MEIRGQKNPDQRGHTSLQHLGSTPRLWLLGLHPDLQDVPLGTQPAAQRPRARCDAGSRPRPAPGAVRVNSVA